MRRISLLLVEAAFAVFLIAAGAHLADAGMSGGLGGAVGGAVGGVSGAVGGITGGVTGVAGGAAGAVGGATGGLTGGSSGGPSGAAGTVAGAVGGVAGGTTGTGGTTGGGALGALSGGDSGGVDGAVAGAATTVAGVAGNNQTSNLAADDQPAMGIISHTGLTHRVALSKAWASLPGSDQSIVGALTPVMPMPESGGSGVHKGDSAGVRAIIKAHVGDDAAKVAALAKTGSSGDHSANHEGSGDNSGSAEHDGSGLKVKIAAGLGGDSDVSKGGTEKHSDSSAGAGGLAKAVKDTVGELVASLGSLAHSSEGGNRSGSHEGSDKGAKGSHDGDQGEHGLGLGVRAAAGLGEDDSGDKGASGLGTSPKALTNIVASLDDATAKATVGIGLGDKDGKAGGERGSSEGSIAKVAAGLHLGDDDGGLQAKVGASTKVGDQTKAAVSVSIGLGEDNDGVAGSSGGAGGGGTGGGNGGGAGGGSGGGGNGGGGNGGGAGAGAGNGDRATGAQPSAQTDNGKTLALETGSNCVAHAPTLSDPRSIPCSNLRAPKQRPSTQGPMPAAASVPAK